VAQKNKACFFGEPEKKILAKNVKREEVGCQEKITTHRFPI
jgi:hypothetical protein